MSLITDLIKWGIILIVIIVMGIRVFQLTVKLTKKFKKEDLDFKEEL